MSELSSSGISAKTLDNQGVQSYGIGFEIADFF
jgi:hypothetical protein